MDTKLSERILSIREQVGAVYARPDPQKLTKFVADLVTNEEAMNYLEVERGLSKETIEHFKLGYDEQRNAIAIPIFKRGDLINFKYRFLKPEKMRYSSERNAETWIYNEDGISKGLAKGGILIVEGEFDLMSAWQAGITNVVSPASGKDSYGTWIEYLDNIPKIYIAYDNDKGGKETSIKMADRLGTEKCLEVSYPDGIKDANEYFKKHTKDEFFDLIKNARPYYSHEFKGVGDVLRGLRENKDDTITLKHMPKVKLEKDWMVMISGVSNVGKCHGKDTKIMMSDGSIKLVQDVIVGDKLMGADSKPRTVLSLARGKEQMYRIWERGEYYDVNESHILSLKQVRKNSTRYVEKTVKEFLSHSKNTQKTFRGWKTGVSFEGKNVTIDPYVLGVWLGDGTSSKTQITTENAEIENAVKEYAAKNNLDVTKRSQPKNKSFTLDIVERTRKENSNSFLVELRNSGLLNNKHIPDIYLKNDENIRLSVLAGLIDTDGHLVKSGWGECYEITQKNSRLAEDIVFLARSLGYRTKMSKSIKTIKSIGFSGTYNRIFIVGDLGRIPVKLEHKKSNFVPKKHWLTSRLDVESIGFGDYYGFTLDGDGLYLLGSFTVTHNTSYVLNLVDELTSQKIPTLVFPFERGIESVGRRFLQVKFNMTLDEFAMQNEEEWNKMIETCIETPAYFAMPKKEDMVATIIKSKRIFNTRVVVIDHLDYIIRHVSGNKEAEIGNTLQDLKRVAEEHKIILLIVSHTRKIEQAGGWKTKKPSMEDLKGSSSLYQDPECVIMLSSEEERTINVDVLKNKGEMGFGQFEFDPRTGKLNNQMIDF